MTNRVIDTLGYIKNGGCDKEHQKRASRVRGAWNIWEHMLRYGYVKKSKTEKFKIIKLLKKDWLWFAKRFSNYDNTGAHEIGALRFVSDVLPRIGRRWFTEDELGVWIDAFMQGSCNIGIIKDNSKDDLFTELASGNVVLGIPFEGHQDYIYRKRVERGDFGDVPNYNGKIEIRK